MARLQDDGEAVVERFQPTSGRFSGWAAVLLSAAVVVAMVAYLDDGFPAGVGGVALLVGVLSWATMLRPALWATEEHLVMRNLAETVHIRLAAVEELAVRQVLAVRAGDRRLVSTVLGRTWRRCDEVPAAPPRRPRTARTRGCATSTGPSTGSARARRRRPRPGRGRRRLGGAARAARRRTP